MPRRILEALQPVRRRQRGLRVLRGAVLGLLAGSLAALVIGVVRWLGPASLPQTAALAIAFAFLVAGPILGALLGLARMRGWNQTAAAVDTVYTLKDRTVTAVDFLRRPDPGAVHELQLLDAEQHLDQVDPRRVVPFRLPRTFPYATAACLAALAVLLWPRPPVQAGPSAPLDSVVAAAEEARDSLQDLEELARKEQNPDLEKLVQKLVEKIDEMKQPGVDVKEALAKLSEMQAAITAQQAQYNVGLIDAQMQSLGEALASTSSFEAAGNALQQQKYDKAAHELEQAPTDLDRKEAKALKEKLKKAAKAIKDAGAGELSEVTDELADSLDDAGQCEGSLKKLGKLARAQGKRKQISDLLTLQSQCLGECKSNCQKNSTAKFSLRKKSDAPRNTWGMSTSGNTDGEKTALGGGKKQENLKGQMGEGPSETETAHLPEGRQVAGREYREVYQKYRKMTEAALNSEPIPLGHRQTIRRYFELIRPDETDLDAAKSDIPTGSR